MGKLNTEVTELIASQKHPLAEVILELRKIILSAEKSLSENIKWNGPNYSVGDNDRITLRIQPPTQLQIIFHRGSKVQKQPKRKIINDESGLLVWKENDRAIATFKTLEDVKKNSKELKQIIKDWIRVTI